MEEIVVNHNERKHKFFIELEGYKSKLKYRKKDENILEIYKTEVPVRHRGKGLANRLAEAAMEYAGENGYKVIPTCSFVQKFLEKNPHYRSLVIGD